MRVNGFTIEVKPSPVSGEMTCHATVRSPKGTIIFEHNEWGIEIDPVTGKDVNGDGQPDAVLVSFSGGAHCCWTYHIISLGKKPGLIREFENRSTASFEDLMGDGQIEILIRDGGFDEGFGLSHPFSPFPLFILRLNGSKFEDVSSKFWRVFEKEIRKQRSKLKEHSLQQFLHSNPNEIHDDLDYLGTQSSVLMIVLDYLYAARPEEARKVLGQLWPADFQKRTWGEMVSGYCSGLRAQLDLEVTAPCSEN